MTSIEENRNLATQPLSGQNVLVTGATGGIGAPLVERLARMGARPVIHYGRNRIAAEALLQRIGGRGWIVEADLTDVSGAFALWKRAISAAGRLHVLVNNAGILNDLGVDADASLTELGRQFALHDRVGGRGQRGAGHDAHALTWPELGILGRSGQHLADHDQFDARPKIVGAHGEAVHRRVGERRHVAARDDGFGEGAAGRGAHRHLLGLGQRSDQREYLGKVLLDGEQWAGVGGASAHDASFGSEWVVVVPASRVPNGSAGRSLGTGPRPQLRNISPRWRAFLGARGGTGVA